MKITVYIQPGAKKTEFSGMHDGMPKLRVSAPPMEGAANKAVIKFIADYLGLPKSALKITSGDKSRIKTLEFDEFLAKEPEKAKLWPEK